MTTYELPPEPPVGSKVHPSRHPNVVWYRSGRDGGWSTPGRPWYSWAQLLGKYEGQGLTLIEPDPWPTARLIVWTVNGDRGLFQRRALDEYVATINGQVVEEGDGNTVSDPIPVRVVPVAEWESLAACPQSWTRVQALIAATDELGLDQ